MHKSQNGLFIFKHGWQRTKCQIHINLYSKALNNQDLKMKIRSSFTRLHAIQNLYYFFLWRT